MIRHTTMAWAFADAKFTPASHTNGLASKVAAAMERYTRHRKPGKDWTANLSYRTYRMLASKGVPLQ